MHPLYGALPKPYLPVRVTRGAGIAHWYTCEPPRYRTSQYHRTIIPLSVSLWNDHGDPVYDGVELAFFKSRAKALYWPSSSLHSCLLLISFLFFHSMGWHCGAEVFGLRVLIALSQPYTADLF